MTFLNIEVTFGASYTLFQKTNRRRFPYSHYRAMFHIYDLDLNTEWLVWSILTPDIDEEFCNFKIVMR